jgi:hypothetical protein
VTSVPEFISWSGRHKANLIETYLLY